MKDQVMYPNDGQIELLSWKALLCLALGSNLVFAGISALLGVFFGWVWFTIVATIAFVVASLAVIVAPSGKYVGCNLFFYTISAICWFATLTKICCNLFFCTISVICWFTTLTKIFSF